MPIYILIKYKIHIQNYYETNKNEINHKRREQRLLEKQKNNYSESDFKEIDYVL